MLELVRSRTSVLIVGGGPVGLALAADLGRRGVCARLVEMRPDKASSPKMIMVSVRTMELCRSLGLGDHIANWGFPLDQPLDNVFCTNLSGYELGRIKTAPLSVGSDTPFSPDRDRPCPQTWFDPILRAAARSYPTVQLDYETKLVGFSQDEGKVVAQLCHRDGRREIVEADYLVGCDGFNSTVREALGIELRGEKHLDRSTSIYIRSRAIRQAHGMGDAYRYVFVGPEGPWGVLTTLDGKDYWRIQLIGGPDVTAPDFDMDELIYRMIGRAIDYEVEDISSWVRKMTVADRFSDGRVFIAGDAAHAHPPNGGLGMNTGIQDSFDLGWKLAAAVQGWGGPSLLASYDIERRPACTRAAGESLKNYRRLTVVPPTPELLDDTEAGLAARVRIGAALVEQNEAAWHPVAVHLGYSYAPSPVIIPDGTSPVPDDMGAYHPNARPGVRAPHAWLKDGRSLLDLFGETFVLLAFEDIDPSSFECAARDHGMPTTIHVIADEAIAELYGAPFVLVRPDGHVAWRGASIPADCSSIIATVIGRGPLISACRAPDQLAEQAPSLQSEVYS